MNLQQRIDLIVDLKKYLEQNEGEWQEVKRNATAHNGWFTPEFIDLAIQNICKNFLEREKLEQWVRHYRLDDNVHAKEVGLVMAGNIPLVGFHDFLCVFITGHRQAIKLSSKDDILLKHIVKKLGDWDVTVHNDVRFAEMLKGCDAYIATGSNNSARYFKQYFAKYPNIIRQSRTSVAVLTGKESTAELEKLSDDVNLYFGLGCRNVTSIKVPKGYDFVPLLAAFDKYAWFADHHKYKNNYDYQLSMALLNNVYYMTNGSTLLIEQEAAFSPISQLNYSFYENLDDAMHRLKNNDEIQCITGAGALPFGQAQEPRLFDYADGVDTMQFLLTL